MSLQERRPLRMLSFDGGGIRCASQLKILDHMIYRIQFDEDPNNPDKIILPCDYFDLCGGSDAGGIIVVMLVNLKMSVEEAIIEFDKICDHVYAPADLSASERTGRLRSCIEDLLIRKNLPIDTKLLGSSPSGCAGFVVARPRSNIQSLAVFRTYRIRAERSTPISIVDAVLATCAAQPEFLPASVGPELRQVEYIGAMLGASNPIRELISEAHALFGGSASVASLVSLGAGNSGVIAMGVDASSETWASKLQSMIADGERVASEVVKQIGNRGFYFRLSVQLGVQEAIASGISLSKISSLTSDYLQDPEVSNKLEECITSLEFRLGLTTLEQLKYSGGGRATHRSLPPITASFVERSGPWTILVNNLIDVESENTQRILVVSGLGGCGKSTLVTKFAAEYQARFDQFFFIDSTSESTIRADLVQSVRSIGPQYSQVTLEEAIGFFTSPRNRKWALIYDNADDTSLNLAPFLPNTNHGVVLITTRNRFLAQLTSGVHMELEVMSKSEAIEALLRSSRRERSEEEQSWLEEIAEEVGYLPVALIQAGCYMFQTGCSPQAYIGVLRDHRRELMETPATAQRDREHRSAYSAFDISYQKISPQTRDFLHIISFFHPSNFPMAAISVAAKASFRRTLIDLGDQGEHFEEATKLLETIFCPSGAWQDRTGHHILASLQNYSLASQTSASETILLRVHPLIHSWANDRISPERRSVLKAAACRLLACACEELVLESHIIAHINAILRTPESICLNDKGGFSKKLDEATGQHAAWTMWESIYQELLERHGPTNCHVATAALEWGKVFKEDLSKAEELMTSAVGVFSSVLGSDDAETIKASLELSNLFRIRGQYPKAETVQREMIDICLEKFGENHEVTISAKSTLSITLRKTYRFTDAEKLQRDVLRQRISQYGEFHSLTFSSMEELGVLAFSLNHNEEAARIFSDLLEKQEKALGKEHLDTVGTRSCLASVRFNQGRYVEAEQMYRQFLKDSLKTGSTHSDVIIAMSNLAKTLMKLEKYAEAARLQRRALVLGIKLLGRLHHSTVCKVAALAETYIRQKRYVRCNKLLSIAFAEVEQHYGRGHQTTLFIVHRLSQLYARTRRLHKAVEFGRLALFERSKQLGETHPGTIQSAENLLDVYLRMGRYRPALLLLFKWTQGAIRDYGESDRRTLQPIVALGRVLRDTKRFRDAEKVQLYALDLAMGLSGNKIEACRAEFLGMASTYDSQGRYFQAKALRDRLLEDWEPTELNEEYVRALLDQSGTLYRMGQKKQAQALWDKFMNYVASLGEANETKVLKVLGKVKKRREFQSPRSLQVRRFRLIGTRKRA